MSFEDLNETTEAHERRIVRCRACNKRIIFLQSETSDRKVPTDADSVEPADAIFVWGRHISHFATCTDPGRFRKTR